MTPAVRFQESVGPANSRPATKILCKAGDGLSVAMRGHLAEIFAAGGHALIACDDESTWQAVAPIVHDIEARHRPQAKVGGPASAEPAAVATVPDTAAVQRRMRDRLLRPADCESGPRRGYVIKHLVAPGDVGAIIGAPGAGKSTLAPFLAYAVAQGRPVFGMRTKPGAVLYVAAEDVAGMRQRVHALKLIHGDAPDLALTDCGNLTDDAARADLLDAVAFVKPALVIIDTVGAGWSGIDENDSAGMGGVVALSRQIAATGAAVLLVHHIAKNGDGTPRGHSILNGTLDMCLSLAAMDDKRIVRGHLTKNRNGACDRDIAFRSEGYTLGEDDDGDAITAPVARELATGDAARQPKLSDRETQALNILAALDTDGKGVAEDAWLTACEDARVSTSETARNRRTAITKIWRNLIANGSVAAGGGRYRLTEGSATLQSAATHCNRLQSACNWESLVAG